MSISIPNFCLSVESSSPVELELKRYAVCDIGGFPLFFSCHVQYYETFSTPPFGFSSLLSLPMAYLLHLIVLTLYELLTRFLTQQRHFIFTHKNNWCLQCMISITRPVGLVLSLNILLPKTHNQ